MKLQASTLLLTSLFFCNCSQLENAPLAGDPKAQSVEKGVPRILI